MHGRKNCINNFKQLLCPDEATAEAYADILAAYVDSPLLADWLAPLGDATAAQLLATIQKTLDEGTVCSQENRFIYFLRAQDECQDNPDSKRLLKLFLKVPEKSTLEQWLKETTNPSATICIKAEELGLLPAEFSARTLPSSSVSADAPPTAEPTIPQVAYEDLPVDENGSLLPELERAYFRENASTSSIGMFSTRHNDDDDGSPPRPLTTLPLS